MTYKEKIIDKYSEIMNKAMAKLEKMNDRMDKEIAKLDDIERICKKQIKENFNFIKEYISPKLRSNKEVVLEAVKESGYALIYASKELRNDKEVVLAAVKQKGYVLEFASEELRNDKEVVLAAIKENGNALQFASEKLQEEFKPLIPKQAKIMLKELQSPSEKPSLNEQFKKTEKLRNDNTFTTREKEKEQSRER